MMADRLTTRPNFRLSIVFSTFSAFEFIVSKTPLLIVSCFLFPAHCLVGKSSHILYFWTDSNLSMVLLYVNQERPYLASQGWALSNYRCSIYSNHSSHSNHFHHYYSPQPLRPARSPDAPINSQRLRIHHC